MQRGLYLISVSQDAVEGGLVSRGEAQPAFSTSILLPPASGDGERSPALQTFLEQTGWERGVAMVILPTSGLSYRRLHFDFSDPKKIRQVLPYELENELLDGLADHAYDLQIVPSPEGGADVHVYLIDKAQAESAVALLEAHQLSAQRLTCSVHALVQADPPTTRSQSYVYLGSEEAFLAHTVDGHLCAVQSIAVHPGRILADLQTLGPGSPTDRLQALFRDDPDPERQELQSQLRERLRELLESARIDVNRFLRINGAGEDSSLSVHGLFGDLFTLSEDGTSVSFEFPEGAWPGGQRTHFGILDELLREPRQWPGRGVNFHKWVSSYVAFARDLRWPLVAAAILISLLIGLSGVSFYMHTAGLEARLAAVQSELRRSLNLNGPITTVTVNAAMRRVEERAQQLRRERQAVAYLDRYHYDMLKLFDELSAAIQTQPAVTVEAMTFNQERLTLSGSTPSYADSEGLKTRIGAIDRFKGQTVKVTHSNAGQTIRYRLTVER